MSTLDHIADNLKVWDGVSFTLVSRDEAKKLEEAGTHQIATGITASQLKHRDQFAKVAKQKPKPKAKVASKDTEPDSMPKKYKTRNMKAE